MYEKTGPSPELRALDRLVGTWSVAGGAEGTARYEWMTGGFFLLQHVELSQFGQPVTGLEVIGHLHPFGEPVGAKGSPAYYEGTFNADGTVVTGDWAYPGGGGYTSTMTRV